MTLLPPPEGFATGHWTDPQRRTGCTVIIPPPDVRGAADVRGGGASTRELQALSPLANAQGPTAVLFTGGSAFGLGAADGVMRWLEERGLGRTTRLGPAVPLVAAAVIFDIFGHVVRPTADDAYAACEAADGGVPKRGAVGAGAGAAVGKVLGRERATPGGVGYAAARLADQTTMAVLAVANAVGDVIDARGEVIGGPRGEDGTLMRTSALVPEMPGFPDPSGRLEQSTTLACVMTDASIDKRGCAIVARMASAGVARAVDPVFSPLDGDVVFCVASGRDPAPTPSLEATWQLAVIGTVAGTLVAEAIRDAVRQANSR